MERATRKDYIEHRARVTQAKYKVDCRPPSTILATPSAGEIKQRNKQYRRMSERNNTTLTAKNFRRGSSSLSSGRAKGGSISNSNSCKVLNSLSPKQLSPRVVVGRAQVQQDIVPKALKMLHQKLKEKIAAGNIEQTTELADNAAEKEAENQDEKKSVDVEENLEVDADADFVEDESVGETTETNADDVGDKFNPEEIPNELEDNEDKDTDMQADKDKPQEPEEMISSSVATTDLSVLEQAVRLTSDDELEVEDKTPRAENNETKNNDSDEGGDTFDEEIREHFIRQQRLIDDNLTDKDTSISSGATLSISPKRTKSLKEMNMDLDRAKLQHKVTHNCKGSALAKSSTMPMRKLLQRKSPIITSNSSTQNELDSSSVNSKRAQKERQMVKVLKPKVSQNDAITISYGVPIAVLRHYEHMTFFMPKPLLMKVLRPRFYIELEAISRKYTRNMGRICFQLFTEASPGIVLEIVRCCNNPRGHEQFAITRIFDPKWIEGEMHVDKSKGITRNIRLFNENVLSHRKTAGILSFALKTNRTLVSDREMLSFAISFSTLEVQRGKRVAIGVIAEGLDILRDIKKFSTKSGKPTDKIMITKCGILTD